MLIREIPMLKDTIPKSIAALDDKNLVIQIRNCYNIVKINDKVIHGDVLFAYDLAKVDNPIVIKYRNKRDFVITYGFYACVEYFYRYDCDIKYHMFFKTEYDKL